MQNEPNSCPFTLKLCLITFINFYLFLPESSFAIEHDLKVAIKRNIRSMTLIGEVDYRRDEGDLFRRHYDIGVRAPLPILGQGWSFGVHYRSVYTNSDDGDWLLEKRPHAQLQKTFITTASNGLPELKWVIRTRQEFRFRENKKDNLRNRFKIKIKSNKKFLNTHPFISNEYFYDFNKDETSKIRLDLGIDFSRIKMIKPSLYYKIVASRKQKEWHTSSSIVLKLTF